MEAPELHRALRIALAPLLGLWLPALSVAHRPPQASHARGAGSPASAPAADGTRPRAGRRAACARGTTAGARARAARAGAAARLAHL